MANTNRLLDDVRIASPCTASWDAMAGDDTIRFCGECKLNVYNISNMTAADAAALVSRAEGRLCVRLYKRADGTMLTRDCPVGLRAAIRRASRAAGAALTAVLGIFSAATAWAAPAWAGAVQEPVRCGTQAPEEPPEPTIMMGKIALPRGPHVSVTVTATAGKVVKDAEATLTSLATGEWVTAEADEEGIYRFGNVEPGLYTLSATAPGHEPSLPKTVRVRKGAPVELTIALRHQSRSR